MISLSEYLETAEVTRISCNQPWHGGCYQCKKETFIGLVIGKDFSTILPTCEKHTDKVEASLRDPANWTLNEPE